MRRKTPTDTRHYIQDGLGHTRLLLDNQGNLTDQYRYDAWGNPLETSLTPNPFTWNGAYGYEWVPFTGLYHVGAREYDPRTARWLQRDPIGVRAGHPNVYLYCANDPRNSADPSGLIPTLPALPWQDILVLKERKASLKVLREYMARMPVPVNHSVDANIALTLEHKDNTRASTCITGIFHGGPLGGLVASQVADSHAMVLWFRAQVRLGGPWDYKNRIGVRMHRGGEHPYEDFGNFNFGATGAAAGFDLETLLRTAGYASLRADPKRRQMGLGDPGSILLQLGTGWDIDKGHGFYGDAGEDPVWIILGYTYYHDAYKPANCK